MCKRWVESIWLIVVVLVAWEGSSRAGLVDPLFLPAPTTVLGEGFEMWQEGGLKRHLGATLRRLGWGITVGGGLGLAAGLGMGLMGRARRALEPVVAFLYVLPKISLLPLLLLWMGVGEAPRATLIGLAAFLTMAVQSMDAARQIPEVYLDVAKMAGAGRRLRLRRLYLPGTMPQLFTGLRQSFGRVLVATISVELVGTPDGLGSLIYAAWQTFAPERVYLGIALIGMLGVAGNGVLRLLEARLMPWRTAE